MNGYQPVMGQGWQWLGGRPALDFVNTRGDRSRRGVERLATPGDLSAWLVQAGLLDRTEAVAERVLREARELREAIDASVLAAVAGTAPDADAVALIDAWLGLAGARATLVLGPEGAPRLTERAAASPREALGLVALDAASALGRPQERARLRLCAGVSCSARFYDRSPAARRRWCSMAGCGNAAKARRHRARSRDA